MFTKILVVGTSCTGKSTLAEQLGHILQIKHFDLDNIYWLPDWTEKEETQFLKDIDELILTQSKWIVAGNFVFADKLWTHADTIVWLNYPLYLILFRYFTRTIHRIITRKKVCGENYESFSHSFLSMDDNNLLLWIFKTYKKRKVRYTAWRRSKYANKHWVELQSQKETDFLKRELKS